MSDHRYYVSVMTPAINSGNITFQLDTYDADYNISVTPIVTGIVEGMQEIDIALNIQTQLQTLFLASGMQYNGAPRFSAEPYAATFRLTRTGHIDCFWSQAQFRLQIISDTTGALYKLSSAPCLITLARATELYGATNGGTGTFTAMSGVTLNSLQIIDAIEETSAELCAYLRNNIAISSYLGEWRTDGMKSVYTSPSPGLSIDQPLIRRKNLYEMYSIPQYSPLAYNWVRHTGELTFRFNQSYVNAGEPFELDNEVRVSFVAGEFVIPAVIEKCVNQLISLGLRVSSGVEEMGGGTFRVKLRGYTEELERIFRPARHYLAKRMR